MVYIRNFNDNDVDFIFDNWAENPRWDGCKFDKDKMEILSLINEFNTKKFDNRYFEQFVITYNEMLVGMISLYHQTEREASVGVFVHQDFRRRGIATKAYSLIEDVAKKKGYKILSAGVSEENHASINMHIKLGFKKEIIKINKLGESQIKFVKEL